MKEQQQGPTAEQQAGKLLQEAIEAELQTGLTPRQLAEQREELRRALIAAEWFVKNFPSNHIPDDFDFCTPIDLLDEALSNTTTPEARRER